MTATAPPRPHDRKPAIARLLQRVGHAIRWRLLHCYWQMRDWSRSCWASVVVAWHWRFKPPRSSHPLPAPLIVSLTSYPPRFHLLRKTLRSLLRQTVAADRTILWVAHADFPLLPRSVLALQADGLEIRATDDLRPYKKIIPALDAFPDAYVCTADDDLYFWPTWLDELVQVAIDGPRIVPCHRAHDITFDERGEPKPYSEWVTGTRFRGTRDTLFPTNGAGTLFPPGILVHTAEDRAVALTLCPNGDDIWLWWIGRRNGASYKTAGRGRVLVCWWGSQDHGLWQHNLRSGGNDDQIRRMMERYGFPLAKGAAPSDGASGQ